MKLFSTTNDSTGGDIAFNTRAASGVNDTDYGTEKMRIKNGGYVGIGTTSPDNKLEVRGNLSISSSDTDSMRIDSGGGVIRRKWTINSSTYGSGLYLSDNVILPTNYLGSTVNLGINLGSTSNRWNTIYTGTLNTSGDVGIGTTSPNEKLEIYGNGIRIHDPSSSPKLDFVRGGTSRYPNTQTFGLSNYSDWRITANGMNLSFQNQWTGGNSGNLLTAMTLKHSTGYVGIGTDNPDRPLHVYNGSGHCWVEIETSASGGDAELILKSTTSQWSIWNNGSDDKLRFYEGGDRMIIDGTGRVGIGAQPGYAWLHVGGAQYSSLGNYNSEYSYSRSDSADWAHQHHPGTATFNWGIYSNYAIGTSYAFVHSSSSFSASDERIKKNIVDADDTECLETLRLLKPKKYQYKDVIKRGEEPVWGFIAQEVRETLPYGTRFIQSVLPNIYELANVSSSNVITFTDFNTSDLESNATTLIRTKGIDDEDHDIHLVEIIDAHTIRVEEDLTKWIGSVDDTGNVVDGNQLFVYGQEVDDFVYIQKDAIWTIATAALQEVDRQLQAEKTKTAALETQLASVLARVTTLENV
jgi:hypothetical protein